VNFAHALAAAQSHGLERLDAQLLLLHALGRAESDRAWLLAHDADPLAADTYAAFAALCTRRATGEPLAYIVGHKEFFGLDLRVDRRVLVPRPETETLVEWALETMEERASAIDLGTGSGAIALALKHARPQARVEAVDESGPALELARENARRLALDVRFAAGSWLAHTEDRYDLIVSNPPYVVDDDPHLAALQHEPLSALQAGPDGLRAIREIVGQAPHHLRRDGWLMLEHGWHQAESVRGLLRAAGLRDVASRCDLAGIERCSGGRWLELG